LYSHQLKLDKDLNLHIGNILNKKIIFSLFLISGFIGAYGQEIPEEFYQTFELYENKVSNNEITLSSNKLDYKSGEIGTLFGIVSEYQPGERVFIKIIGPDGTIISDINVSPTRDNFFKVQQQIPHEFPPGNYNIEAKYTELGKPVLLMVRILPEESGKTYVNIPSLAEIQDSGKNFFPDTIRSPANIPIVWINNDKSVHTVVSGQVGFNNKMFSDGKFDSGTFGPGDTFSIFLPEGKYDYFCKLHPWLIGSIIINPSTDPDYIPPELGPIEPVKEKPILNDGYLILKTDKEFYLKDQEITLLGSVQLREADLPVSIQIFDPTENLITIDQITPNLNRDFILILPLAGNLYSKNGQYKIIGQYGVEEHKTEITFLIHTPKLVENDYKGYDIHQAGTLFIAIPNPEGSVDVALNKKIFVNPSFEEIVLDGNKLLGWSTPSQNFDWELDEKTVTSGKHSLKLSTSSDEDSQWSFFASDEIDVMHGDVYLIETNMKQNNAIQSHISIIGKFLNDESKDPILLTQLPGGLDGNFGWINYKEEVTIPDGVTSMQFVLNAGWVQDPNMGKSITWFDDFEIKQTGSVNTRVPIEGSSLDDVKNKIDNIPPGPYFFEQYKGYSIFLFDGTYYAILGNFDDLEPSMFQSGIGLMAETTHEKLLISLDQPLSPIPKEVYLEIWNERPDLQSLYPEVKFGNFYNFRAWASTEGWKEDPRLALFKQIEEDEEDEITTDIIVDTTTPVTGPEKPTGESFILTLQIIVVSIIIGIGSFYAYRTFYLKKQSDVYTN